MLKGVSEEGKAAAGGDWAGLEEAVHSEHVWVADSKVVPGLQGFRLVCSVKRYKYANE